MVAVSRRATTESTQGSGSIWRLLLAAIPALVTLLCFLNALGNDFTNWDDPLYVVENKLIRRLSIASIRDMFSSFVVGNYHPLTMLSLAMDYALYALQPSGYHLTSVLIHICNVSLVFIFVQALAGRSTISFVTALLFGIHPLHVESVAWVSERKDVLYPFFYLSSMCAYLGYVRRIGPAGRLYSASLGLFICSLLSKGQAVTLPVVLLLIDSFERRQFSRSALVEKLPFLVLSLAFGILAIVAQTDTGAIPDLPNYSLSSRLAFAVWNASLYLAKLAVPIRLSAFYPYPELNHRLSLIVFYLPAVCVVAILAVRPGRIMRFLITTRVVTFGVGFFVANILLLLQIVPVGASMIAERYTYLCSAGLFFLVGAGIDSLWNHTHRAVQKWRVLLSLGFVVYSGWLAALTIERNKVWRGSEALWNDVLAQFPRVGVAYLNRGSYYHVQGKFDLALADFDAALALYPDYKDVLINRCDLYRIRGEYERALADCDAVINRMGASSVVYSNRAIILAMMGRYDEALVDVEQAISLEPSNPKWYTNRGNFYDMMGRYDTAIENYSYALSLQPDYGTACYNRGKALMRKGDFSGAIKDFDVAARTEALRASSYAQRSRAAQALREQQKLTSVDKLS